MIKVMDISKFALSEKDGLELRKQIISQLKIEKKVFLDFAGITLFATPFFNSSFGYFYMQLKSESKFYNTFEFINLNPLGEETLKHTLENAQIILDRNLSLSRVGEITSDTIMDK